MATAKYPKGTEVKTNRRIAHMSPGINAIVIDVSTSTTGSGGEPRYQLETAAGCPVFAAESELDTAPA